MQSTLRLNLFDATPFVGRALVGGLFVGAGAAKLMSPEAAAGLLRHLGLAAAAAAPAAAGLGLFELLAGAALMAGWRTRQAAAVLAGFVMLATVAAHPVWSADGALHLSQFLKNLAVLGALLILAGPAARDAGPVRRLPAPRPQTPSA